MADVLALYAGGILCLAVFAGRTVRQDSAARHPVDPDWRGWLLAAVGVLAILAGTVLAAGRLFGG